MDEEKEKQIHHNDWGEAWVMCRECGAKLYSTDGYKDIDISCPYERDELNQCTDKLKR